MTLQLWQRRFAGLRDELLSETHLAVPEAASPPSPQVRLPLPLPYPPTPSPSTNPSPNTDPSLNPYP